MTDTITPAATPPASLASPVPGVPRWVARTAHAVPLCLLPSGLWRISLVAGWPHWYGTHEWLPWEKPYVLSLTLISEGLALLTLGLVRPWGEVMPRWVPFLGGRKIPVRAAVIPAATGAILVTAFCAYATLNYFFHFVAPLNNTGEKFPTSGPGMWALVICYVPMLAWGPLLGVVTVAYYRRRTRRETAQR